MFILALWQSRALRAGVMFTQAFVGYCLLEYFLPLLPG